MSGELQIWEIKKIKKYWRMLQDNQIEYTQVPFSIDNIVINVLRNNVYKTSTKITRDEAIELMKKLFTKIYDIFPIKDIIRTNIKIAKIHIYTELCSKYVSNNLTKEQFVDILDRLSYKIITGMTVPGKNIGTITATSIGSITTQLILNAFHMAGAEKTGKVTQNMQTLQGLLNGQKSPNIDSIYTFLYFKDKYKNDMEISEKIIKRIPKTIMSDILVEKNKVIDTKFFGGETDFKSDKKYLKLYLRYNSSNYNLSETSIRLKFSKKRMFHHRISIENIIHSISIFKNIHVIQLGETIIRIYLTKQETGNELDKINDIYKNINNINITGIKGIKYVNLIKKAKIMKYDKDRNLIPDKQNILMTVGSNLLELIKFNEIDIYRIMTNDCQELLRTLGIEAARKMLIINFYNVIINNGANINIHYIHLLVDFMTHHGNILPISVTTVSNHGEPGQIFSYEKTESNIIKASIRGDIDELNTPSSNIMLCQIGPYNSGLSKVIRS